MYILIEGISNNYFEIKNVNETMSILTGFLYSGPLLAIPLIIFKSFYVNFFSVIIDSELSIS